MKLSKSTWWTVLALAVAGVGYAYKTGVARRNAMFEEKIVELELEVLEGEGGICLG